MTRWLAIVFAIALTPACEPEVPTESPRTSAAPGSAQRIVTLAPHLAEFVVAVGAGDRLVGVSAYSDFPPEVLDVPVISDAFTVDQEQLALLEPDLVLAWHSGTPAALIDELQNAGYDVVAIETRGLDDIGKALTDVAQLAGASEQGRSTAAEFEAALARIAEQQQAKPDIAVFYQVSGRPLYTVSGRHYISEIIGLCGGRNIFAELGELAPTVDVEAVIERDPEVLLAGSVDGSMPFGDWNRWPSIAANRYGNRFVVSADAIGRPSLRLVQAAEQVCAALDIARRNREEATRG